LTFGCIPKKQLAHRGQYYSTWLLGASFCQKSGVNFIALPGKKEIPFGEPLSADFSKVLSIGAKCKSRENS
jgi:hypothetical protein